MFNIKRYVLAKDLNVSDKSVSGYNKAAPTSVPTSVATSVATSVSTSVAAESTAVAGGTRRPAPPGALSDIPVLDAYTLGGITYTVDPEASRATLARRSGEARIIVAENGGRRYVLKIYIPNHGPHHDVLDRVQQAGGGFLVPLRDHGRWEAPGGRTFDYEVMDYLPYASLADSILRGSETRLREVALRMAFAIRQCHSLGIIHRDIKPENFLYTSAEKNEFVMIDFGIARSFKGYDPVKVDAAKSSYFVSPEGAISSTDRTTYVGPATDYYSMGMTLLALWMGVDNFYKIFPASDLPELDRLKRNNNVISKLRPRLKLSDHAASLLERLLEFSDNTRAGFDDVQRWYKGETLKTGSAAEADKAKGDFRVVYNEMRNQIARSPEELAAMMLSDIKFAKKFLYKGLAKSALQSQRPMLAIEIDDLTQARYPRPEQQDMGVYAAALLLDRSMTFTGVRGNKCSTTKEIAAEVWKNRDDYFHIPSPVGSISPEDKLWAYLAIRGDEKVRTFPEKYRPLIHGPGDNGIYALVLALDPDMPLYMDDKNCDDKVVLAAELWKNRKSYSRELVDPMHPFWRKAVQGGTSEADVKLLCNVVKKDGELALYDLCLGLDPNFPLYSEDAKRVLRTQNDIADELLKTWIWKDQELANSRHPLWGYLRRMGSSWKTIADTYPAKVKADGKTWLWDLYYRLGSGRKALNLQYNDGSGWHYAYNLDEVVHAFWLHGLTDYSVELLTRPHFATWLAANDCAADTPKSAVAEKIVKDLGANAAKNGWYLLYSLVPDMGLNGCRDKSRGDYGYTAADLGKVLNKEICESLSIMGRCTPNRISDMLNKGPAAFRASQLAQYMRARKMGSHIDSIAKAIDISANDKAHPSVRYTFFDALWRTIAILGHKPTFYFKGSKRHVSELIDLLTIPVAERRSESKNELLLTYLSTFFHERPGRPFSVEQAYDYLCYLNNRDMNLSKMCLNFSAARSHALKVVGDRDKAWAGMARTRKIIAWCCLIPMAIVLGWMVGMSFSDTSGVLQSAFKSTGEIIGVLLAICGVIVGFEGGIIGAAVCGLICYWIPVWLFGWLSGGAPFILSALLGAGAVWCAVYLFKQGKDTHIPNKKKYDNLVSQNHIYAVTQAYGTADRVFGKGNTVNPADTFTKSANSAAAQKKSMWKAAAGMIGITVVTMAIGILLLNKYNEAERNTMFAGDEHVEEVAMPTLAVTGSYEGTFDGAPATMQITRNVYNDSITGEVSFTSPYRETQRIQGRFFPDDNSFSFNQESMGKMVPGVTYMGKFTNEPGESLKCEGRYINLPRKHQLKFSFTKKED